MSHAGHGRVTLREPVIGGPLQQLPLILILPSLPLRAHVYRCSARGSVGYLIAFLASH